METETQKTTPTTSLFDHIRKAAEELRGSGIDEETLNLETLDTIKRELKLDNRKEAMIITIFAVKGNNGDVDLSDMANFLACSEFDAMTLSAALKSLADKGFIVREEDSPAPMPQYKFADDILEAIVEGREVRPMPTISETNYDQFDFCEDVHKLMCRRVKKTLTTKGLFYRTKEMEDKYPNIEFISKVKEELSEVKHRIMLYDLCYLYSMDKGDNIEMRSMLKAMYSNHMDAAHEQKALRLGDHPLLDHKLVTIEGDEKLKVDDRMLQLLYGDAAEAFLTIVKKLDRYSFVAEINKAFYNPRDFSMRGNPFAKMHEAAKLETANEELAMVKTLKLKVPSLDARMVFYLVSNDRVHNEDFQLNELDNVFVSGLYVSYLREFKNSTHPLVKTGLVEVKAKGLFDDAILQLTEAGEALLFEDDMELFEQPITGNDIIQPDSVVKKRLFFDDELQKQLSLLGNSLKEENYQKLVARLEEKRMPTGICALLHGLPGTGKTEATLQLARETGRIVMLVDIASSKSCWFGETEKIVKGIFTRYKRLCKKSKLTPILLFNEADGILSKRKDVGSSNVAQTENAVQNIILQEMETLKGIMICTTNLVNNLDAAFERRFLFKVRFDAPTLESKCCIWMDKLPSLSKADAAVLAGRFAFSGGEIDNIARKATMDELVSGTTPTLETIINLCTKEKLGNERQQIGFAC